MYPNAYHQNAECTWTINVSKGSKIHFIFLDLDLESSTTCRYDYVEIYDGSTRKARLVNNNQIKISKKILPYFEGQLGNFAKACKSQSFRLEVHFWSFLKQIIHKAVADFTLGISWIATPNCPDCPG